MNRCGYTYRTSKYQGGYQVRVFHCGEALCSNWFEQRVVAQEWAEGRIDQYLQLNVNRGN